MYANVRLYGSALLLLSGCSQLSPSLEAGAMRRRFVNVGGADVFAAAEQTLREEFRVETLDRNRGYLRTHPKVGPADRTTGWIGDAVVPSRSRVRRVAEMRVTPTDDAGVLVVCKVTLERRDTDRRHAFAPDHYVDDNPSGTPEDLASDAGAPREVWTPIGSDDALERQLLQALEERLILMEPAGGPT